MAAANRWIAERHLPTHNEASAVMLEQIGSLSRPYGERGRLSPRGASVGDETR
jgi:hypothetical protein